MAKATHTNGKISDEEFAAYQAESNAIWEQARQPDFDWSTVPLTYISSTTHTVAWCRCHGHPDLKEVRADVSKSVLKQLDTMYLAAGFTKDGKTLWRKGDRDLKTGTGKLKQVASTNVVQNTKTGFFGRLKRAFDPAISMVSKLPNPLNLMATSVYIEFQRDRAGASFYINAGIRPGGLHLAHSDRLAAEAVGSRYNGYYIFRPVYFTPDLPSTLKPDPFEYMRLKEDPRFMPFMLELIEKRMLACLSAWADPTNLKPPLPSEMAGKAPLKM